MKNALIKYCFSLGLVLLNALSLLGATSLPENVVLNQLGNTADLCTLDGTQSGDNDSFKGFSIHIEQEVILIEVSENEEEEEELSEEKTQLCSTKSQLNLSSFYLFRSKNIRSFAKQSSLITSSRPLFLRLAVFRL